MSGTVATLLAACALLCGAALLGLVRLVRRQGAAGARAALRFRNLLPFLIGAAWLALTWGFVLGGPTLAEMKGMIAGGELAARYAEWEVAGWFLAMIATMIAADRLLCASLDRFFGVDPMKTHWSRLRNRDGAFFCARCRSIFMLPPEDLSDEGWVHCGDCGHAVAPYGEMKPLLLGWASKAVPPPTS